MKAKNTLTNTGSLTAGSIHVGDKIHIAKGAKRPKEYPAGCIGADLAKRNYVKYLVERYHKYREADGSFGRTARFNYAVIFKNIEAEFKAPTYFIPLGRFEALVEYLHGRVDNTILGRGNRKRGTPNYESFDEYVMKHMEPSAQE